jgi:hypothetical protein
MSERHFRVIELGRAAWGAALLTAPRPVMSQVHHLQTDTKSLVTARILGGRHLAQAALSGIQPTPEVLAMGVWVDSVHALSAVGLALADGSRARAGLTDAAVAAAWAILGYRDLNKPRGTQPGHDRRRNQLACDVLRIAPGGTFLLRRVRRHPLSNLQPKSRAG